VHCDRGHAGRSSRIPRNGSCGGGYQGSPKAIAFQPSQAPQRRQKKLEIAITHAFLAGDQGECMEHQPEAQVGLILQPMMASWGRTRESGPARDRGPHDKPRPARPAHIRGQGDAIGQQLMVDINASEAQGRAQGDQQPTGGRGHRSRKCQGDPTRIADQLPVSTRGLAYRDLGSLHEGAAPPAASASSPTGTFCQALMGALQAGAGRTGGCSTSIGRGTAWGDWTWAAAGAARCHQIGPPWVRQSRSSMMGRR